MISYICTMFSLNTYKNQLLEDKKIAFALAKQKIRRVSVGFFLRNLGSRQAG